MTFWSWLVSGLALAAVPLVHWLVLGRAFAVSGRYTALIDALRFARDKPPEASSDTDALIAALRAQTQEMLGEDALEPLPVPSQAPAVKLARPQSSGTHLLFLAGLVLGGLASVLLAGEASVVQGLRSTGFAHVAQRLGLPEPALLVLGGVLVGAGTRMAGGCTSGHGLCGVSQRQLGSLVATAAFFGAGVATSFALGALR